MTSARPPIIRAFLGDEVIADNFAGGGGASLGIELALGRSPDLAVNHDPEAIAMHAANHPTTEHRIENVWQVDPRAATRGKPVALAWFSPDCKHHSKAKGGKPREQKIRGLAWVAVTWAARVRPRVIALENVEEFRDWGPLHRVGPRAGQPIAARRGETFRAFVRRLERLGYVVEHRLLRACDFGAPTTRRRLFLIARRDGRAIAWPEPTHGPIVIRSQLELGQRAIRPYRTAAEVIDWSIPCPSIFDRERPLADKTMARIARGIRKFVLDNPRPFVVPAVSGMASPLVLPAKTHGGGGNGAATAAAPLRTITASKRGEFAIAVPYLVHRSNGERPGQEPRIYDAQRPLGTIVAQGQKHAACVAFLAKHYGDRATGGWTGGTAADRPIDTITSRDHHSAVVASVARHCGERASAQLVAAFLARYNGESTGQVPNTPIGTLDTTDRYALVTVTIGGEPYVIVDIGMRMLTPRELFRAQGFGDDYQIAPSHNGKPLSKTAQIRMCGNSVCPPIAAAIVRAQFQEAA